MSETLVTLEDVKGALHPMKELIYDENRRDRYYSLWKREYKSIFELHKYNLFACIGDTSRRLTHQFTQSERLSILERKMMRIIYKHDELKQEFKDLRKKFRQKFNKKSENLDKKVLSIIDDCEDPEKEPTYTYDKRYDDCDDQILFPIVEAHCEEFLKRSYDLVAQFVDSLYKLYLKAVTKKAATEKAKAKAAAKKVDPDDVIEILDISDDGADEKEKAKAEKEKAKADKQKAKDKAAAEKAKAKAEKEKAKADKQKAKDKAAADKEKA